ncbi:MAG: hypothetical protein RSA50_00965 [Mucinivorans sp.]
MFRRTFLILIIVLCSTELWAQQIIKEHGDYFSLDRSIVLRTKGISAKQETLLREKLMTSGAHFSGTVKGLFSPRIIVRRTDHILGAKGPNALQITVSSNKVLLEYTSTASLNQGLKYLMQNIENKRIRGVAITDWNSSGKRLIRGGTIDLTSGTIDMALLKKEIHLAARKSGNKSVTLELISPNGWAIESSVFDLINPNHPITYPSQGNFSLEELSQIKQFCDQIGVRTIFEFDFRSENDNFMEATGFKMNSVEGMRFIRALLEQWSAAIGMGYVNYGEEVTTDARYEDFLKKISHRLNLEIIE